jgi:hypothetical protein
MRQRLLRVLSHNRYDMQDGPMRREQEKHTAISWNHREHMVIFRRGLHRIGESKNAITDIRQHFYTFEKLREIPHASVHSFAGPRLA